MIPAPTPHNESERLRALRACEILETESDRGFDELVELASQIFDVPIALVSLIDEDRQWFKAKVGLTVCETGRDVSFCGHAVAARELLVVNDARADERFADNPFVTEPPHIRFYAGAPLIDDEGHALGTLCLIKDEPRDFTDEEAETLRLLAKQVSDHIKLHVAIRSTQSYQQRLEEKVWRRTEQLAQSREEVVHCLARAGEYRDDDTGNHVRRVSQYTRLMCEALGLPERDVDMISLAATLHDVGKIGVPDKILLKPAKLSDTEFKAMQAHTTSGAGIIRGMDDPTSNEHDDESGLLELACEIAMTHHEMYDGSGYPHGLRGDQIPLSGRIVAVADVFDAVSSSRPYKSAYPLERCLEILQEGRGSHFDPAVLDAFWSRLDDVLHIRQDLNDEVDAREVA